MSDTDRVPPHSHEAEVAVLGAVMLEPQALPAIIPIVKPEHFYRADHQRLFAAMLKLFEDRKPVDVLSLREQLKLMGENDIATNADLFVTLSQAVPSVANAKYYAEVVAEKAMVRGVITRCNELLCSAYDGTCETSALVQNAQASMLELSNTSETGPVDVGTILNEVVSAALEGRGTTPFYSTGFHTLDRVFGGGVHEGQVTLIGGRPGSGKTTVALSVFSTLIKDKVPTFFSSMETPRDDLIKNLLCMGARVTSHQIDTQKLDMDEWRRVKDAAAMLYTQTAFVEDRGHVSITDFRARCQSIQLQHGLKVAFVDYVQLMSGGTRGKNWSRLQELTDISRGLKIMAMDMRISVVALVQLNRVAATDRPQLHHLRECGAFEQDADNVILLDADPEDKDPPDLRDDWHRSDMIIAKQRRGPCRTLKFIFQADVLNYAPYDETTQEEGNEDPF